MKLFEYSALVTVHTVIAAETQEEADAEWASIYSPQDAGCCLVTQKYIADVVGVSDGELFHVRDPYRQRREGKSLTDWLDDEAHIIVEPKGSVTT